MRGEIARLHLLLFENRICGTSPSVPNTALAPNG